MKAGTPAVFGALNKLRQKEKDGIKLNRKDKRAMVKLERQTRQTKDD